MIEEWGFDKKQTNNQVPTEQRISELLAKTGYEKLAIQSDCVQKSIAALSVNLSAIAKGYGVDELATYLWQQGFHHFMVEIGGELRLHGHNPEGMPWRIGVESPQTGGKIRPIAVSEVGVATSGDYRNYFERDGVRFSHTIDPATGKPITHNLASVTVVAGSAAKADALATAFSVMGGDKTMALAAKEGIAVYLIERAQEGFSVRHSPAFAPYLLEL